LKTHYKRFPMSWLTRVVRPKIRALVSSTVPTAGGETADNLWHKCTNCGELIFHRDYKKNLNVCPKCLHHGRFSAKDRLSLLFGDAGYTLLAQTKVPHDPLKFKDKKRYADRLKDAQATTGEKDAVLLAEGLLGKQPAVIAVFDFSFMAGSMGVAVGEALLQGARRAVATKAAYIVIPASGGARMQESMLSLMQMARTTVAVQLVKEAGLPYIVLLTDPTTGGVTASFAMLGDITVAEPGAVIGFAGARVIEETIREKLPDGFQRAEYLLEHGMIDRIIPRSKLREELTLLVSFLMPGGRLQVKL
jgi:acetyl-CoA carboxylase carboxyl transferase subunit beta